MGEPQATDPETPAPSPDEVEAEVEAEVEPEVDAEAPAPASQPPLLPARLTRFAPFDPEGERKTRARLERLSLSALRQRRAKIDERLYELGLAIGEPALEIPSVRGTGIVDLDRILKKINRLDDAQDQSRLERDAEKADASFMRGLLLELDWLGEVFMARELRTRKNLLMSELGLALCACDHDVLAEYAPHVKRLMDGVIPTARRVDELFVEARLVDEEFDRRRRAGQLEEAPKEADRLLSQALDAVDDVSSAVGDRLLGLGKDAAKTAAKASGVAAWELTKGAARGAWALGSRALKPDERDGDEDPPEPVELGELPHLPRALPPGPDPAEVPRLIRELAALRDDGLLTPEEFAAKKAELLKRL